jgi:hypothetical protein
MGANDILNTQLKNKYLLDSNNFEEIIIYSPIILLEFKLSVSCL